MIVWEQVWEFAMVASSEKRSKRKEKLNKRLLAIDNLESPQGQKIAQAALKYLLKNTEGKQSATSNTEIVPSTLLVSPHARRERKLLYSSRENSRRT
jgi:hypothetical protein